MASTYTSTPPVITSHKVEPDGFTNVVTPRLAALRSATPDSWIALSQDESRVIATGKTYRAARQKAKEHGEPFVLTRTPKKWGPQAFLTN